MKSRQFSEGLHISARTHSFRRREKSGVADNYLARKYGGGSRLFPMLLVARMPWAPPALVTTVSISAPPYDDEVHDDRRPAVGEVDGEGARAIRIHRVRAIGGRMSKVGDHVPGDGNGVDLSESNRPQEPIVRLNPERLQHNFSRCWPRLKAKLDYVRNSHAKAVSAEPAQAGVQIVEAIKPRVTNSTPASECAESLLEPTVHPRRRGVSSLRPPISKHWDETVRPRIRGVSSLRTPSATRWGAV